MSTIAPSAPPATVGEKFARGWSGWRRWPLISVAGGLIAAAGVLAPLPFLVVEAQDSGWGALKRLLWRHTTAGRLWESVRLTNAGPPRFAALGAGAAGEVGGVGGLRGRSVPGLSRADLRRVQARLRRRGRLRAVARARWPEHRRAGWRARADRARARVQGRAGSVAAQRPGSSRAPALAGPGCAGDALGPGTRGAGRLAAVLDGPRQLEHAPLRLDPLLPRPYRRLQRRRRRDRDAARDPGVQPGAAPPP